MPEFGVLNEGVSHSYVQRGDPDYDPHLGLTRPMRFFGTGPDGELTVTYVGRPDTPTYGSDGTWALVLEVLARRAQEGKDETS